MNEIVQSLKQKLKKFEKKWDLRFGQMIEIYLLKDLRFDHEICPSLLQSQATDIINFT